MKILFGGCIEVGVILIDLYSIKDFVKTIVCNKVAHFPYVNIWIYLFI